MAPASKKLLKELPSDVEMKATILGLLYANDQAAAVAGAAHLEYALELMLKSFFRPLGTEDERRMFDGAANGILGTMSNKIRLAFAVYLINEEQYGDFKLINDIRNAFAHTLHNIDFNNHLIKEDCQKLKTYKPSEFTGPPKSAKEKYLYTLLSLYFRTLVSG
jgi:DNA-binding MltR family transcriptional regulator